MINYFAVVKLSEAASWVHQFAYLLLDCMDCPMFSSSIRR